MMIAVVILGLGLIMVATLFPVSWTRARLLAEFTSQTHATAEAEASVKLLARVDGERRSDGSPLDALSFKGDQVLYEGVFFNPNSRVHAMNMQNIQVEDRKPSAVSFVPEYPWENEPFPDPFDEVAVCMGPNAVDTFRRFEATYFQPQFRFCDRVYPPMQPPPLEDDPDYDRKFERWNTVLDSRRYAWTVFHKLGTDYVNRVEAKDPADPSRLSRLECPSRSGVVGGPIETTRTFTMYYVTLRRPRAMQRFARQKEEPLPNPYSRLDEAVVRPRPPDEDLMFPVPWRVQITMPEGILPSEFATAVPTEVGVNVRRDNGRRIDRDLDILVEMFRRGTVFIDELNGHVYRVEKRRLAGKKDDQAFLTLDREIVLEDINDFIEDEFLQDEERLRAVWVFPPSVKRRERDDDPLVFDGAQPVVGVDIRTLTISPSLHQR